MFTFRQALVRGGVIFNEVGDLRIEVSPFGGTPGSASQDQPLLTVFSYLNGDKNTEQWLFQSYDPDEVEEYLGNKDGKNPFPTQNLPKNGWNYVPGVEKVVGL